MANLQLTHSSLNNWFLSPLGQELLIQETARLELLSPQINHGFVLQLGTINLLKKWEVKKSVRCMQLFHENLNNQKGILGEYQQLPFTNASIDLLLMPHILETEADIYPVLEEAWRVLGNNGRLVIFGFNPWSYWGLKRFFTQESGSPWNYHFYSCEKLRRFINELSGEVILSNYFFFRPPVNNQNFLMSSRWAEQVLQFLFPASGGVYILVARKNLASPVKLRKRWQDIIETGRVYG